MKKIIKQDGVRRVFIYDDGSEEPFNGPVSLPKTKKKKGKKRAPLDKMYGERDFKETEED